MCSVYICVYFICSFTLFNMYLLMVYYGMAGDTKLITVIIIATVY